MAYKQIKRVEPLSLGKILGAFGAISGFLLGLLFLSAPAPMSMTGMPGMYNLGAVLLVLLPIVYGIVGFIMGIVYALIYNWLAKQIGGIRIDI
ncbi:MAG: hypothetical protein J7K98_04035 [Candidatus Aenigmarchaeota archaeon]|nr:hypothetical protein [Candidatus Aenigmarchaeota archaeon]